MYNLNLGHHILLHPMHPGSQFLYRIGKRQEYIGPQIYIDAQLLHMGRLVYAKLQNRQKRLKSV